MGEKRLHIELFSGCGGLSLGLESAGYELLFANEMSPMAGETFAYNILNENLEELAKTGTRPSRTLWIKSQYSVDDLSKRLRENPHNYNSGKYTDLNGTISDLKGKLLIGDIDQLLDYLQNNPTILHSLQEQNVDLISGGPPCQGFSMAGKRIKEDKKNLLPESFAKFAGLIQPKIVLLENVKGITTPFFEDGKKFYAWIEISKAFACNGFVPLCMLVNSKYFGIPQNRPRFILIGIRENVFLKQVKKFSNNKKTIALLQNSYNFFKIVNYDKSPEALQKITIKDLNLYNIENNSELFNGEILPKIKTRQGHFVTAKDAIGDILDTSKRYELKKNKNQYCNKLLKSFKQRNKNIYVLNHESRKHSPHVMARFRVYQIISKLNGVRSEFIKILNGDKVDRRTKELVFSIIKNEKYFIDNGENQSYSKFKDVDSFVSHLKWLNTKKHSQRALKENEPAFAQLTIPDDVCHYHVNQLRTMTVREMARIQSFPDWFEFRSKVTTGGMQRCYEVPQYTQVGNAVPPLLGLVLGNTINNILSNY